MSLRVKMVVVGPLQVNCYLVYDDETKETILIDPGDEPDRLMDFLKDDALTLTRIVCTHTHFDHIGGLPEIKEETGVEICLHKDELSIYHAAKDMAAFWGHSIEPLPEPEVLLTEGDTVKAGRYSFTVLHTPGHTPGGICLYGEGIVITGDTLFEGSVGRTDLPGGSMEKLKGSFKRLMALPPQTKVYPGHGPQTSIGHEQKNNFFRYELT